MTLRLVALMSVVLLLSLAAFGLLANHYQKQLMEEVLTTASDVGQAALRTLDWTSGESVHRTAEGEVILHEIYGNDRKRGVRQDAGPAQPHKPGELHEGVKIVRHVITTSTEDEQFTVREQMVYPAEGFPSELPGEQFEDQFEACLQNRVNAFATKDNRIFINVEEVRAETDPLRGLVLKIPKWTPTGNEKTGAIRYEFLAGGQPEADVFFAERDEIQLPIGGKYQELFTTLRNRSLLLFLGVFVVGMVLSTGVASRFTRPIRKLDSGIRKLSDGDLDVKVDVDQKGEIGRLAHTFNEMARKLHANREREREMVRREKLSALGRLAAGVAHDVRNPLHSIGLTLQHLDETARPEAEERSVEFDRAVGVIRGEIKRLDQIVGNFLSFAKSERRDRSPIDLGELVEETVRLVRSESDRRRVSIEVSLDESLPTVSVDGEAIRSAMLNLILNSFEAMPEGGALAIALRVEGSEIVLEVADTGEGIPEEEQEHVFDFAYTTRESGHGLGLAMVHHCVVEEHGGRVALDSSPAKGTRVSIALPLDRPKDS